MKKFSVISGIVIVVLLIIFLIVKLPKNNPEITEIDNDNNSNELKELINTKINHDKLIKILYSNSGDSNGNIDRIEIDLEALTIKTEYKENYSDPLEVKEYSIKDEDLTDIKDYIEKYNFVAWSTLEIDRDNILDGPLKSIILSYDNTSIGLTKNDSYVIAYNTKIPREGYPLLNSLVEKIVLLKTNATIVNEYEEVDVIK